MISDVDRDQEVVYIYLADIFASDNDRCFQCWVLQFMDENSVSTTGSE